MAKYKAYLNQGQGCDYTIGCGQKLIDLKATSLDEAQAEVFSLLKEAYSYEEWRMESVEVLQVQEVFPIAVEYFYNILDSNERKREMLKREQKEKEEFERLKAKFENK